MKHFKTILLGVTLSILLTAPAFSNSTPVVMEEGPGFSMAPVGTTPISVVREDLEFDMTEGDGHKAAVTASYKMANTSDKPVEQVMLFPYVTEYREGFTDTVQITAGGKPADFKVYRLDDIPFQHNYKDLNYKDNTNDELADKISIDNIVNMLNNCRYEPKNFNPEQLIKVYTLHLPRVENEYLSELSFKIDNDSQKLIHYNFNGMSYNSDGTGELSTWCASTAADTARGDAYLAVLDGGSRYEPAIKSITNQDITVEEKTVAEFLKDNVVCKSREEYGIHDDELYSYAVKKLDEMLDREEPLISMEDVISSYLSNTYAGVFVYAVKFDPKSTVEVTVKYDIKSTIDRRRTRNYTNMFLYLLRPASGWKDFGGLDIKVIPNSKSPYIMESSLDLAKDGTSGIYSASFNGLPDKDFYFITYEAAGYDMPLGVDPQIPFLPIIIMVMVTGIAAAVIVIWRKHNRTYK